MFKPIIAISAICRLNLALASALYCAAAGLDAQPVAQTEEPRAAASEQLPLHCTLTVHPTKPGTDPTQGEIAAPSNSSSQGQVGAAPANRPVGSATSSPTPLRADLVLRGNFKLGNVSIPWGSRAEITTNAAVSSGAGKCIFNYRYFTRNRGQIAAASVSNRVFLGPQGGMLLASALLPALDKNSTAASMGEIALYPGVSTLCVSIDATDRVAESNETNNIRGIQVQVSGDCASP